VTPFCNVMGSSETNSTRIMPSAPGDGLPRLADAMGHSEPATNTSMV
jgi:hypothetical protein